MSRRAVAMTGESCTDALREVPVETGGTCVEDAVGSPRQIPSPAGWRTSGQVRESHRGTLRNGPTTSPDRSGSCGSSRRTESSVSDPPPVLFQEFLRSVLLVLEHEQGMEEPTLEAQVFCRDNPRGRFTISLAARAARCRMRFATRCTEAGVGTVAHRRSDVSCSGTATSRPAEP